MGKAARGSRVDSAALGSTNCDVSSLALLPMHDVVVAGRASDNVGVVVGASVGATVGTPVGAAIGTPVGAVVGAAVGAAVGTPVEKKEN